MFRDGDSITFLNTLFGMGLQLPCSLWALLTSAFLPSHAVVGITFGNTSPGPWQGSELTELSLPWRVCHLHHQEAAPRETPWHWGPQQPFSTLLSPHAMPQPEGNQRHFPKHFRLSSKFNTHAWRKSSYEKQNDTRSRYLILSPNPQCWDPEAVNKV